jgi:hypothetical protein
MALPGETSCRPVAGCGDGKWGDIPVEPTTVYVDASHTPAPGSGTENDPFVSLTEAMDAVADGGMMAVAAGGYAGDGAVASKPMRIWGRCPEMVTITGDLFGAGVVVVAGPVELHTVAVEANGFGVSVTDGEVLLDRVWIHDTAEPGVFVSDSGSVTLRDSLIERATGIGAGAAGTSIEVERSVIRHTLDSDFDPGRGVSVELSTFSGAPASLILRSSVVRGSRESGVAILGATAIIEGSVIVDSQPASDGRFGQAVTAQRLDAVPADAAITDSYLGDSHAFGISVLHSKATLERVSINSVVAQAIDDGFGDGLVVAGQAAEVTLSRSYIGGAARAGVANFDATATLEGVALDCNTIHLNGESLTTPYSFSFEGGNACACGDVAEDCKVLSSSLEPPSF